MAVKGLDRFIEYLSGHRDAFVLIGGSACDIWFKKGMPAHKIGKLWKFKISEVDDWAKSGRASDE